VITITNATAQIRIKKPTVAKSRVTPPSLSPDENQIKGLPKIKIAITATEITSNERKRNTPEIFGLPPKNASA